MAVLSDLTSSAAKHRVFISYSHDSEEHRARVKSLADTVGGAADTDCVLDQYVPGEHPIEGWPRWMEQQFDLATRVLCICTERYLRLLTNDASVKRSEGRGAHWESELFLAELYREKSASKKLKAVVLPDTDPDKCVPTWLAKWGWLTFPESTTAPAYRKLLAYIADAAPTPGRGLPDAVEGGSSLSTSDLEFIKWIRADTVSTVENVKVLGMSKPIRLLDIYYPVVLSTTIASRLYESQWARAEVTSVKSMEPSGSKRKRSLATFVVGSDYMDGAQRVVVLGGPGAGKTTFLKSLALKYCGATNVLDDDAGFAVFVHLPTVGKSELGISEWIDSQLVNCDSRFSGLFRRVGARVRVTFLLDSLDEVPSSIRADTLERIRVLERQFPSARIVLSCRTADYQEKLESFSDVEIARLSTDAIAKIVPAWFVENPDAGKRLLSLISADEGVRSLTETPLLLSLLCIQFRHDLDLPKRRVELYERCVSVLLRDWDSERKFRRQTKYEKLTEARRIQLFENVAGHFMSDGGRYDLPEEEMHRVVGSFIERCGLLANEASEVLAEVESLHGIIERLSRKHYCFSHNTLQDYFTACRIAASRTEMKVVAERLHDEVWEPVIEFLAAILDEPWPVIQILLKASSMDGISSYPAMAKRTRVLILLYRCLCSSPLLSSAQRMQVIDHLIDSHRQMAKIYSNGGVYPFAILRPEGVMHTLLWTKKRPTLAEALKPFRQLSNLILLTPVDEYCDAVLSYIDRKGWKDGVGDDFQRQNLLVQQTLTASLLVPIASARPDAVTTRLNALEKDSKFGFVTHSVSESTRIIAAKYAA